jgi:hypothetical protein
MTPPETTVDHVKAIRASLPNHFEFDERDLALLALAEQQAADVDALVADVRARRVRNENGMLNSAVREARQARIALARILGQVDMPEAGTGAQIHGRKAAHRAGRRRPDGAPAGEGGPAARRRLPRPRRPPAEDHEHPPERLAELEAAWWAYRDEIMADYGHADWKPAGWEMFEARAPTRTAV